MLVKWQSDCSLFCTPQYKGRLNRCLSWMTKYGTIYCYRRILRPVFCFSGGSIQRKTTSFIRYLINTWVSLTCTKGRKTPSIIWVKLTRRETTYLISGWSEGSMFSLLLSQDFFDESFWCCVFFFLLPTQLQKSKHLYFNRLPASIQSSKTKDRDTSLRIENCYPS